MVDTASALTSVNQKIFGSFTGINFLNVLGWFFAIVLLIGAGWWVYVWYSDKKLYNKKITGFEVVGGVWTPTIKDTAKVIKIGKSGLEILYLKNLKTWKIAFGGRVGKSDYYFFILNGDYWYNGYFGADVLYMNQHKGLVPVVTTNPLMRGQYVALEKQVDDLHAQKPKWWDKYGGWVMSIAFVLIAGVLMWLNYKQFATVSGNLAGAVEQAGNLLEQLARLTANTQALNTNPSGLIPV